MNKFRFLQKGTWNVNSIYQHSWQVLSFCFELHYTHIQLPGMYDQNNMHIDAPRDKDNDSLTDKVDQHTLKY